MAYAWQHRDADAATLLLHLPAGLDGALVGDQVEGWRTAAQKWPTLAGLQGYRFPPRLNREQSSSEAAARYKAAAAGRIGSVADLTGGMGIDTWQLAAAAAGSAHYVERAPLLCRLARHNLPLLLSEGRAEVHETDCLHFLQSLAEPLDLCYIDPARRDAAGRRVVAFEQCTPDLLELLPLIGQRCRRLMVKASPMVDIKAAVGQLGCVSQVHVVAVQGECKEVLFIRPSEAPRGCDAPEVHCVDLRHDGICREVFGLRDASAQAGRVVAEVGRYVYEPNAAIMKSGCQAAYGVRLGLPQLSARTHLYTSDTLVGGFAGRIFEVEGLVPLSRKAVRAALPDGKAHVVCRNYPVRADRLQQQLGLREGGSVTVIATTVGTRLTGIVARQLG